MFHNENVSCLNRFRYTTMFLHTFRNTKGTQNFNSHLGVLFLCGVGLFLTASTLLGRLSTRLRCVSVRIEAHSFCSAFMKSGIDVKHEGLAHDLCSSSSQKCSMQLKPGLGSGQSTSSTPNSSNLVFIVLALSNVTQSRWNRKRPSSKFIHNVASITFSKMFVHHWK